MKTFNKPTTPTLRELAFTIFKAGITSADPYLAVKHCLTMDNGQLAISLNEPSQVRTDAWSKIHLIAFGKAACPMVKAALDIIPPTALGRTIAVTNYENVTPIEGAAVIGASHPLPDESGFNAAKRCADIARSAKEGELVLVLVSGGGSALIPYPAGSISLTEKIRATDLLLASGANINQMNCVRKHLSHLKGGGLARLAAPADVHALILSDVIGDDVSVIASGPTIPDETGFNEAIAILKAKHIWQQMPDTVRQHLDDGRNGKIAETPKPNDPIFNKCQHTLVGSNRMSVKAITASAYELGFKPHLYSDTLCGEAKETSKKLVLFAKESLSKTGHKPLAILAGGETTVTIKGNGKGGRNQEMALAFAINAERQGLPGNWVFLSGGTDGRDGPTDAAGGMVDSGTIQRISDAGLNPVTLLANNDSYAALKVSNDLLITGATGTNVADLQILLVHP